MARILFVDQFAQWGGGQHVVFDVIQELQRRGHTVVAALPEEGLFSTALRDIGVEVFKFQLPKLSSGQKTFSDFVKFMRGMPQAGMRLRTIFRSNRCDSIYLNGARCIHPCFFFLSKVPTLFYAHLIYSGQNRRIISGASKGFRDFKVICPSQAVQDALSPLPSILIPNWIRDEFLLPVVPQPKGNLVVGIAGRISKNKGQDLLIEAMRPLLDAGQASLKIAGDSDFEDPVFAAALRESAPVGVEFLGAVKNMPAFYDSVNVLAVPSETEAFGLVAVEAMARARPVVASLTGGLVDIVQDGVTGLFAERTIEGLREAIESLTVARCVEFGDRAQTAVIDKFSKERNLALVADLFN